MYIHAPRRFHYGRKREKYSLLLRFFDWVLCERMIIFLHAWFVILDSCVGVRSTDNIRELFLMCTPVFEIVESVFKKE